MIDGSLLLHLVGDEDVAFLEPCKSLKYKENEASRETSFSTRFPHTFENDEVSYWYLNFTRFIQCSLPN